MFCPKCGKELPDGSIACCYCATVIFKNQAQAQQMTSYASNAPKPATNYTSNENNAPSVTPTPSEKKSRKAPWVWVALLAIVAVLCVGSANFFAPKENSDPGCCQLEEHFVATYFGNRLNDIHAITFTNTKVPSGVTAIDVSEMRDGSVMAWLDGNDLYVTTPSGKTLYAPEDCSLLFSYFTATNFALREIRFNNFDTSKSTTMTGMFSACSSLKSLDVSGFDTSLVADMSGMFWNCSVLTSLDLSVFNTAKVTDMSFMFGECTKLASLDISGFDTAKVTNMKQMFSSCSSLTTLDVSNFDTANVTDMTHMFTSCNSLTTLAVSNWDVSNVTAMNSMFYYCTSLTQLDLENWNVTYGTDLDGMFSGCTFQKPSWY